jgi:class 3 adenylate cyclase/predicted ATPase
LVTHADRLVAKATLLDAVWPETTVSDVVVRIAIGELRRALGDTVQASRYIATVQRRGYRFVAPVVEHTEVVLDAVEAPPLYTPDMPPQQEKGPSPSPLFLPAAERRHLTVLCCNLVGPIALTEPLDPEEYREVLHAYHQACAEVMQRYDGYVAQYLGDGVLVYFGYPVAHEDDPQRAVRAGLALLGALAARPFHPSLPSGEPLVVRLGVHTGLTVVDDVGAGTRHEPLALGETPTIAARLPVLAAPNALVVSAATWQLVADYFRCKALGAHTFPGVTRPVDVYHVLGASGVQSRLEVAALHVLTPLVGRVQEVGILSECWTRVTEGLGQVVLLTGEPGIGKSRLVQVLTGHVADAGYPWMICQGSPYYQHTALYPLIELLGRVVPGFDSEASALQKRHKLEAFLRQYDLPLAEVMPFVAGLLALPLPATYAAPPMTPEQHKQHTFHALLRLFLRIASQQPFLLVIEDLHWVDPSTLEWLSLLVDQGPTTHILALCTYRPDFSPPWTGRAHLTQVTLARLSQHQTTVLTHQVAHGKALPAEVAAQIVAKTDGVPLFVEEVTRMMLESGLLQEQESHYTLTGPLPSLAIPVTLHDALLARLDRLGAAKGLAQLGATLGREFAYALLQAVAPWHEEAVPRGLQQLVEAELLYQRGLPPLATYVFKHALIQDVAYQSLLKQTRREYHQQIAQVLVEQFPETAESQPELLAHHYTEAGLADQAVDYWQRAGQRAVERSAHLEAISHLTVALELLATLPDTLERAQQELLLQTALGPALVATRGFAAPEVEAVYTRARELCRQIGETPQLFPVLAGLRLFYTQRAEYQIACELGEQLLTLAQRVQDPAYLLVAHQSLGVTLLCLGELVSAHTHVEQGWALYDALAQRSHTFVHGLDPGITCLSYVALALWLRGYPVQALQRIDETLALGQALSQPFSLAYARSTVAWLHQCRREGQLTQEHADTAIACANEQGFPYIVAFGSILRGWALAMQGQGEQGLAQLCQGLAAYDATGSAQMRSQLLALLAEVYGRTGQVEAGLKVLVEALTAVERTGEHWWEAELYRLKGELLRQSAVLSPASGASSVDASTQTSDAEAEICFHHALDVARRQQAKSLELRAAISLSQLWQQQGKEDEARDLLATIYDWFTDGFDTPDLQQAKALLHALEASVDQAPPHTGMRS